jgi:hypothetical protein
MKIIFKANHSDHIGSFRPGWQSNMPEAAARKLIAKGVASAVDAPAKALPKRKDTAAPSESSAAPEAPQNEKKV